MPVFTGMTEIKSENHSAFSIHNQPLDWSSGSGWHQVKCLLMVAQSAWVLCFYKND